MRTHRRTLTASALLAAIATAAIAISAQAASPVKITNCFSASIRPKALTLTCGDGNTALTGLKWSSFGATQAKAKGTFAINECEPNCAYGKVAKFPVTVTASAPRTCKRGLRVYNKLTLVFPDKSPPSPKRLSSWTLGCPT